MNQPSAKNYILTVKEDSVLEFPDFFSQNSKKVTVKQFPNFGNLKIRGNGISYIPQKNYSGTDDISYSLRRWFRKDSKGKVKIYITPVNDPPVLYQKRLSYEITAPDQKIIQLKAHDPDDNHLRFSLTEPLKYGAIDGFWPILKYTPSKIKEDGIEYIRYKVVDALGKSDHGLIIIHIKKNVVLESSPPQLDFSVHECLKHVEPYIKNGAVSVGTYAYESSPNSFYIPASTMKIASAAAALNTLGANFRFKTKILFDKRNIYLKGEGDPTLDIDDYKKIFREIEASFEKLRYNRVVLDTSVFSGYLHYSDRKHIVDYFEAPLSALSITRNSVNVVKHYGYISMLDKQLPLSHYLKNRIKEMPDGRQYIPLADQSIGVSDFLRQMLKMWKSNSKNSFLNYAIDQGKTPEAAKIYQIIESRKGLKEIVQHMLKFSNNFIANQVLLVSAYKSKHQSVDLIDAVTFLSEFLEQNVQLNTNQYSFVEGSGLSRKNKISLGAMKILMEFYKSQLEDLPFLSESRYKDLASIPHSHNVKAKTGSLKDVFNVVGYIKGSSKNNWTSFIIFLNQKDNTRSRIMKEIIKCVQ